MTRTTHEADLASQARQLRESSAALYEYLQRRDRALERALARIPSQADVELGSVFNAGAYLEKALQSLAPGVAELAISSPASTDGELAAGQTAERER